VAVETLNIKGLARTRLAKSVHDAGWGVFITELTHAGLKYGCTVLGVSQWEPTSQVCSACGIKDGKKPLSVRVWACGGCGTVLDRDYNAALNIMLAAGLAESLNDSGGDVRLRLAGAVPVEAVTTPLATA
jgi:putative transposase